MTDDIQVIADKIVEGLLQETKMTLVYDLDYHAKKATVIDVLHPYNSHTVDLDEEMIDDLKTNPAFRQELEEVTMTEFKSKFKDFYENTDQVL